MEEWASKFRYQALRSNVDPVHPEARLTPTIRQRQTALADRPTPALRRLAALLAHAAPHDGLFDLPVAGAAAIRMSKVTDGLQARPPRPKGTDVKPAVCLVAQGAKMAMLGREIFEYRASRLVVFSVDLPTVSQVTEASRSEPFLCFKLDLDPYRVAGLALKVFPQGVPRHDSARGVYVSDAPDGLIDAACRLLEIASVPEEADLLGSLVVDEIVIRLLRSGVGPRIAQIGHDDSGVSRIARAVSEIREQFAQPLLVDRLARLVHMSPSAFHKHFKAITAMSPLQYQKVLRLQEARRLLLSQAVDARSASRAVGYLSASQFSREYARHFGSAPTKDIARLRDAAS